MTGKIVLAMLVVAIALLAIWYLLVRKGLQGPQGHVTAVYGRPTVNGQGSGDTAQNIAGTLAGQGLGTATQAGCLTYGGPPGLCQAAGNFSGSVGKLVGTKVTGWVEGLF